MATTFIKEPSGIYPAYNDSFIEFSSDIEGSKRAEITVSPESLFPNVFTIYPNSEGVYMFNLKECVKVVLNQSGFSDNNFFTNSFYKTISGNYLIQSLSIEIFGESTSEVISKNYEFFKSVKQIGEYIFENNFQILSNSKNGVDYNLTYFEGFPFHFDIQRVLYVVDEGIKIVNKNSEISTELMNPTSTGSFRVNIDRGEGVNFTSENFLPLSNGLNKLEIYEDDIFKVNLNLKKVKKCEGVYLKWFNNEGGFSHWLFNEFDNEEIKAKDIDFVNSNQFNNVGSLNSGVKSVGKEASRTLKVRTRCDKNEYEQLKSLFTSPLIQMYSSKKADVKGVFIDVRIEETYKFNSKKANQEFVLNIELPELLTARL